MNYINRKNTYRFLLLILSLFVVSLITTYFSTNVIYTISLIFGICILLILKFFIKDKSFFIETNTIRLIMIFLLTSYLIVNLYSIIFYFLVNTDFSILELLTQVNVNFFTSIIKSLILIILYILGSFYLGKWLIVNKIKLKSTSLELFYMSVVIGLSILGTLMFFLALFNILEIPFVIGLLILIPIINYKDLPTIYKRSVSLLNKNIRIKINNKYQITFYIIIFLALASVFASLFRAFPSGPDALRDYLNMIKFLSEKNGLHEIYTFISRPFFTEILFSPGFMIGGVPVTNILMFSVSSTFLIGIYLILKTNKSLANQNIFTILLLIFFCPFVFAFYTTQFKIDIFWTSIVIGSVYFLYNYLTKKEILYLYYVFFLLGIATVVKLTTLFLIVSIFLYILYTLFRNELLKTKNINLKSFYITLLKLILIGIIYILPILPWIIVYKIDTQMWGNIGLGLMYRSEDYLKLETGQDSCSMLKYELKDVYGWDTPYKKWILFPYKYLTGPNGPGPSIADPGLQYLIILSFWLFYLISFLYKKRIKYNIAQEKKILLKILFFSLLIAIIVIPELAWYALPIYLLIMAMTFEIMITLNIKVKEFFNIIVSNTNLVKYFEKIFKINIQNKIKRLADLNFFSLLFIAVISVYCIYNIFLGVHSFVPDYINSYKDKFYSESQKEKNTSSFIVDAYLTQSFLNKNTTTYDKYIFAFQYSAVNANYFAELFYDKIIFFDTHKRIPDNNEFQSISDKYNAKYFVHSKSVNTLKEYDCIYEYNNSYKKLFNRDGQKILQSKLRTVYSNTRN